MSYIKIIHQIWYDIGKGGIPEKYIEYQKSWKDHHPDWQYILWDEPTGDLLMKTKYPQYYDTYKNVKYPIMKIDILRYCILDQYGGMYADMDYKCLTNFDNYLSNNPFDIHLNEQPNQTYAYFFGKSVSNSLIIATKRNHPFWKVVLQECFDRIKSYDQSYHIYYVIKTTGPGLINDTVAEIKKNNPELDKTINLLPFSQFNFCNDCNKCNPSKTEPLYAVHDYMSYWNSDFWLNFRKIFSCYSFTDFLPFIIIAIIIIVFVVYKYKK